MITLKHAFYESGRCPDFAVIPNPDTSKLFKNHRCIVKSNVYGLSVYVPVENQHPLIRFADDSRLFFELRLQNDEFALYTDQRVECSDPTALQFYQVGTSVKPGQDILTEAKVNEVLLSVAVQRDFNQINAIPYSDEIRFFAKPVLWFYYVVTDPGNSEQLAIVDASQEAAKTTTWQRHTSLEGDSIYTQLIKQYPAMAVICFVSEQTLDCHESCSRHLQLKLGDHVVFDQLPSPGYQNYFHLGPKTDTKPTDAIYEIVKYFSNTTLIKG
ncbi:MAG: hypothetical protein ACXV79_01650 [Methylobacter sp.]